MGQTDSTACHNHLTIIKEVCQDLGIPLDIEKLEGLSQRITFLGITTLDMQHIKAQLPSDKLLCICNQFSAWLTREKAAKGEILSLVGLLHHAYKFVRPGRLFVSQMYITTAKLKQLSHYTRLNKDFRSDLYWWNAFISIWNGISFLQAPFHQTNFDCSIQTGASGSCGCGAFSPSHWFQYAWTT